MRTAFNSIMIILFAFLLAIMILTPITILTRSAVPNFQVGQKWSSGGDTTMQIVASNGDQLTIDSFQCQYRLNDVCQRREHIFVSQTRQEWAEMLKAWKFVEVKQ